MEGSLSGEETIHLAGKIKGFVGIEEVDYGGRLVETLSNLSFLTKTMILGVGVAFGMATFLIIFNTIKLTLFSRQREIEIMRLVGATNWFISLPYILEGTLQGLVAGGLSSLLLWVFYEVILYRVHKVGFIPFGFSFLSIDALVLIISVGIGLGCLGALVSAKYFLSKRSIYGEKV